MRVIWMIVTLALVAGCGDERRKDQVAFDGQYFSSKASKSGNDRAAIEITVRPVSQSLEGALEAGRYESTRYCIKNFGTSAVEWTVGPDQEPESYVISNDTLVLSGSCVE